MSVKVQFAQTLEDTLGPELTPNELWARCEDAARMALRGAEPVDRADCTADLFGEVLDTIARETAADMPSVKRGRPADVIAHIDHVLTLGPVARKLAERRYVYPLRSDKRFTFTGLRMRAGNWREARDVRRSDEELNEGGKNAKRVADTPRPDGYVWAAAGQDARISRAAARMACDALGIAPGSAAAPSDAYLVFYEWARAADAAQCAAELGIGADVYRARKSRGSRDVRSGRSATELMATLLNAAAPAQRPRKASRDYFTSVEGRTRTSARNPHLLPAGTLMIALADESREAHGRTPAMAPDWREGTAGGEWPERPNDAREAREACRIDNLPTGQRTSGRIITEEDLSGALRRLGGALSGATGRMGKNATGRTSGKPAETYASRAVRLGKNAG